MDGITIIEVSILVKEVQMVLLFTSTGKSGITLCMSLILALTLGDSVSSVTAAEAREAVTRMPGNIAVPVPTARPDREPPAVAPIEKPSVQKETDKKPDQSKSSQDERVYQVACPALSAGDVEGKLLPPIEDDEQCGSHSPLSLTAIGKAPSLKFAAPITTNCAMAVTLAQWSVKVNDAAKSVYGNKARIAQIGTGSDYQCRKVNGASEGRVSEHAFANALDIMSFTFSDGEKTELESGWNGSEKERQFWRSVHRASCELFMTVIGPDGDAAHKTNMHLDQGCHGKACLARICQ